MKKDFSIFLNFLPILEDQFSFTIFRKIVREESKSDFPKGVRKYSLPPKNDQNKNWPKYWISFSKMSPLKKGWIHPPQNGQN
jgi:hypothetical protein